MNSYDFFIYEFICFMNSYMNSGVPRFQMSGLHSDQPCRRRVSKGDEFNKAAQAPLLLRQQQGRIVPAPLTSLPRVLQVRVPKLAQAILRPARVPFSALLLSSQAASADEKY